VTRLLLLVCLLGFAMLSAIALAQPSRPLGSGSDVTACGKERWVVKTTAQRAALALDLLPKLEEEAHERQRQAGGGTGRAGGDSRTLSPKTDEAFRSDEKAAALVGVGRSTIASAKAIQRRDPEAINRMRAGEVTIAQAARQVGLKARGA